MILVGTFFKLPTLFRQIVVQEQTVRCLRTVQFFCDVRHVRSSVLDQNVMFRSVRSLVLLLCDQTSLGTYSLMFANCSVFCDVRHVRSSILGQNVMFGKFDVRTFNVRSVRSSVFWCSFQDQSKAFDPIITVHQECVYLAQYAILHLKCFQGRQDAILFDSSV